MKAFMPLLIKSNTVLEKLAKAAHAGYLQAAC
jgi:hypothetical protein